MIPPPPPNQDETVNLKSRVEIVGEASPQFIEPSNNGWVRDSEGQKKKGSQYAKDYLIFR
jgi:hypothetical protein